MTVATFASQADDANGAYRPGVCNIGPAEIARRRMAGHVGLIATVGLLAVLVVVGAPPLSRLLVILPAAVSASGYLQAKLKFCAGFGSRGIFNFGTVGESATVADPEARAMDRRRSRQISLWALAIGVIVGAIAVLLPV
jgi:ferric-dicitrate binding protein FerR (iron transport regulator)